MMCAPTAFIYVLPSKHSMYAMLLVMAFTNHSVIIIIQEPPGDIENVSDLIFPRSA